MKKLILTLALGLAIGQVQAREKPYWGVAGGALLPTLQSSNDGTYDILRGPDGLEWRDVGATLAPDSDTATLPVPILRWGSQLHAHFALEGSLLLPTGTEGRVRLDNHVFSQSLRGGGTLLLRPQLPFAGGRHILYAVAGVDMLQTTYKTAYFLGSQEEKQTIVAPALGVGLELGLARGVGVDMSVLQLAEDLQLVQLGLVFHVR